jgi:hypothetical protein
VQWRIAVSFQLYGSVSVEDSSFVVMHYHYIIIIIIFTSASVSRKHGKAASINPQSSKLDFV